MAKFKIFTDSCSDLPKEVRQAHDIEFVYMGLVVDGEEKRADINWEDYSAQEFYGWLNEGKKVKTTQVSIPEFESRFKAALKEGYDVLYIGCSSKLTGSLNTLLMMKDEFLEDYPERKIIGIDSLNASASLGLMVISAAELRDQGKSIEEVAEWVEANKLKYNFFATVETLTFLKNAGRIKGAKAFMGNLLHKKPIFISDRLGNNLTIGTVTGTKNADNELIKGIQEAYDKNGGVKVVIAQGLAEERALKLQKRLLDELNIEAEIWWIGPIVGTTCGPGIIATFCYGKEVTRYEGDGK